MARISSRTAILVLLLILIAVTPTVQAKGPDAQPAIAAGTQINVRLKSKLRSNSARVGDQFRGRLETPITADGRVLYPKGTEVSGYVVSAHPSARAQDPGVLELDLIAIGGGTSVVPVTAKTLVLKGELHKKTTLSAMRAADMPGDAKGKQDTLIESDAVLTWVAASARQDWSKNPPSDVRRGTGAPFRVLHRDQPEQAKADDAAAYAFNDRDRRALRRCLAQNRTAKSSLPPGSEKQLRKDGTLSAGLQKRALPLPSTCTQQLSPVPRKWARVVLSGRVMLLDPGARIVDVFVF